LTLRISCLIGSAIALGLHAGSVQGRVEAYVAADFSTAPVGGWHAVIGPSQEVPIEETYRRQCAACHGEHGRGDGRMARRFKPPPADFRNPQGVARLTDEELIEVITEGRASMPAFGDVLSEDVIAVMVTHVRELSRGVDAGHGGTELGRDSGPWR